MNCFRYPKSHGCENKANKSALCSKSADIFCFRGNSKLSDKIGIVSTSSPTDLEKSIEANLNITPLKSDIKRFKNGEIYVNIPDNVRGKDIYIMPSGGKGNTINDDLMEMYLKADAVKRAGAKRAIAVMPNFAYARQEKRTEKGEPIAARLNMDLLRISGVDELITADLHTPAIEGCAPNSMPITHLQSLPLMKEYIQSKNLKDLVVVSPDVGGTKRAENLAKALGCDKAIVYKHRQAHNQATAEDLVGNVEGKTCILYDDIIDTAGTIAEASKLLDLHGAKEVYVCATHGLFNGEAMQKLQGAPIKEVIVTNSVPLKTNPISKIKSLDIGNQIADAMKEISA